MVQLEKPVAAKKKAASVVSGRQASPKTAGKRAAPRKRRAASRRAPLVSVVTAGGYTVFGSPVQPAHLTTEQIAQAIAELD